PGEAHAAAGGAKQLGVLAGGAGNDAAVAQQEIQAQHAGAEATLMVVVLAVDVAGDGAANADEACAGRDGWKPALRYEYPQQGVERGAGGAGKNATRRVETA